MSAGIYRFEELKGIVGMSRKTVARLEKARTFPRHVQLAGRAIGWLKSDVAKWVGSRQRAPLPRSSKASSAART